MDYKTELNIYRKEYNNYKELFYIFFISNIVMSLITTYNFFNDKTVSLGIFLIIILSISSLISYKRMRQVETLLIGLYLSHLNHFKDDILGDND